VVKGNRYWEAKDIGMGGVGRKRGSGQVGDFSSGDTMVCLRSSRTVLFWAFIEYVYIRRKLEGAGDSLIIVRELTRDVKVPGTFRGNSPPEQWI